MPKRAGQSPVTADCSIERSLEVLGERWTFLILREAHDGVTRFADFMSALRVAPDILSDRLATLVAMGVMEKQPYSEPGKRARDSYHLTTAGRDLRVVLGALQQWGDAHLPREAGPTAERRDRRTGERLSVGFVVDERVVVPVEHVDFYRKAVATPASLELEDVAHGDHRP